MAQRRMFHKELVSSDKFLDMPLSTQSLFFHLGMNADDEGFVSSPKRIGRSIGCSDDDIKILIAKFFIVAFESGVIVITDWNKHNQIRKDRFTPTIHKEEKQQLQLIEYQQVQPIDNQLATSGKPSIGKVSLVQDSKVKKKVNQKRFTPPTLDQVKEYCLERKNNVDPNKWISHYQSNGWKVGRNPMKDWKAAVRTWEGNNYSNSTSQAHRKNDTMVKDDNGNLIPLSQVQRVGVPSNQEDGGWTYE